jgi:hypothetical protein
MVQERLGEKEPDAIIIGTIDTITKTPRVVTIIRGQSEPIVTYPSWEADKDGTLTIDHTKEDRPK